MSGDDQAEADTYFDAESYRFHGPDGFESDYTGLSRVLRFDSCGVRRSFDPPWDRRGRGPRCRLSDVDQGHVRPGVHAVTSRSTPSERAARRGDLSNIFRFDDQGRLVEEWVRADNRSFLRQLGAEGR